MESCILGVLFQPDEFFSEIANAGPIRIRSGGVPERTLHKRAKSEDDSQSDPHLEARVQLSQTTQSSDTADGYDNTC